MKGRGLPAKRPRIAHYMPYRWNNSLAAIDAAVKARYWGIDRDCHVSLDGVVVVSHWDDPAKDGMTWIWTGRYTKSGREIREPDPRRGVKLQARYADEILRLRSRRFGGFRIYTLEHHIAYARARIRICPEAKQDKAFEGQKGRRIWRELREKRDRLPVGQRTRVIVMTLQNLGNPWERLEAAHPWFPTVLLPRAPKPPRWDAVEKDVDAVWGAWR